MSAPRGPEWFHPLVDGKPRYEDQSRNGVQVIVRRTENGSTVEADCHCMGSLMRTHSNPSCPLLERRNREKARWT